MGAYAMDSHHTQRFNHNGSVKNEGGVYEIPPAPYPISYRSLIPKVGECENLLVPWCLSTSHMAFGSARMEPVFMTLSQSAATAAVLAINDGTSVQEVPYEKLASVLRADGQVLSLSPPVFGIIVDSEDTTRAVVTGNWTAAFSVPGFNGNNYLHDGGEGRGQKSVRFTPVIPATGNYRVSLRWNANSNRATNVPIAITHGGGVTNTTVNQKLNGDWYDLGVFSFIAGTTGNLLLSNTGVNGYVIADAAMWTRVGVPPTVRVFNPVSDVIRGDSVPAAIVFNRDGNTDVSMEIFYQLSGTADPSGLSPSLTGSVTIPPGQREIKLPLAALSSVQPQGEKTLVLQLSSNASYTLDGNSSAIILVRDTPFDSWRFERFSSSELADPSISGPFADPDGNGAVNLLHFFSGSDGSPRTNLHVEGDTLYFQFDRHQTAASLGYAIEESSDLLSWIPSPRSSLSTRFQDSGDVQQIHIPVRSSGALGEGKKFFRLTVVP